MTHPPPPAQQQQQAAAHAAPTHPTTPLQLSLKQRMTGPRPSKETAGEPQAPPVIPVNHTARPMATVPGKQDGQQLGGAPAAATAGNEWTAAPDLHRTQATGSELPANVARVGMGAANPTAAFWELREPAEASSLLSEESDDDSDDSKSASDDNEVSDDEGAKAKGANVTANELDKAATGRSLLVAPSKVPTQFLVVRNLPAWASALDVTTAFGDVEGLTGVRVNGDGGCLLAFDTVGQAMVMRAACDGSDFGGSTLRFIHAAVNGDGMSIGMPPPQGGVAQQSWKSLDRHVGSTKQEPTLAEAAPAAAAMAASFTAAAGMTNATAQEIGKRAETLAAATYGVGNANAPAPHRAPPTTAHPGTSSSDHPRGARPDTSHQDTTAAPTDVDHANARMICPTHLRKGLEDLIHANVDFPVLLRYVATGSARLPGSHA